MSVESPSELNLDEMLDKASNAAATLNALSNPQRLMILCHLLMEEELSVSELQSKLDLSQSALSQHLAKLRAEGMVGTRKHHQQVFYRVTRDDVRSILGLLYQIYCKVD